MRIMALDVGDKTIGVAASDALKLTAQGIEVIKRTGGKKDFVRLAELVETLEISTVVIGFPKNMNGTIGERGEITQQFATKLSERIPQVKVRLWDERLSTVAAEKSLIAADVSRQKRKQVIDKMAAVFILQGYLDKIRLTGE